MTHSWNSNLSHTHPLRKGVQHSGGTRGICDDENANGAPPASCLLRVHLHLMHISRLLPRGSSASPTKTNEEQQRRRRRVVQEGSRPVKKRRWQPSLGLRWRSRLGCRGGQPASRLCCLLLHWRRTAARSQRSQAEMDGGIGLVSGLQCRFFFLLLPFIHESRRVCLELFSPDSMKTYKM